MIFITIGTQEPFDRLIKAIDEIAFDYKEIPFVAQVAKTTYKVKNMKTLEFVTPVEFNEYFNQAKLIVSHAGMGTIITALETEKPILVFPRLVQFKEHRNNHQLATAQQFEKLNYVSVAYSENELKNKLASMLHSGLQPLHKIGRYASPELISEIKKEISYL